MQIIGNLYEVEKTLKSTGSSAKNAAALADGLKAAAGGKNAGFLFQQVPGIKDLPVGAKDPLLDVSQHFIHSDVDSVPLLPILEPSSIPTGRNHIRYVRESKLMSNYSKKTQTKKLFKCFTNFFV